MTIPIRNFDVSFRPTIRNVTIFRMHVGDFIQVWKKTPDGNYTLLSSTKRQPEQ